MSEEDQPHSVKRTKVSPLSHAPSCSMTPSAKSPPASAADRPAKLPASEYSIGRCQPFDLNRSKAMVLMSRTSALGSRSLGEFALLIHRPIQQLRDAAVLTRETQTQAAPSLTAALRLAVDPSARKRRSDRWRPAQTADSQARSFHIPSQGSRL